MSWDLVAGGGSFGLGFEVVVGECVDTFDAGAGGAPKPRPLSADGDVAEVLKKPSRDEFARRAMRMFSSVRKLSLGEEGDKERDVPAEVRLFVLMGGGCLEPSEVLGFDGAVVVTVGPPNLGPSLTIGEYCDMGDEPLNAPGGGGWRCGGGAARDE
jgi:hypothetical protein